MSVRVVHGANEGYFPAEGKTVEQIALGLREVFNIPDGASAFVEGEEVPGDHILADGSTLEFVRTCGCKGGHHDYWSEEELRAFFGDEEVQKMKDAGMKLTPRPVLLADEVISWGRWLWDRQHDPSHTLHVCVDIENESITLNGKTFDIDKQLAAVIQCLLDAKGERRSQEDMKEAYPTYITRKRLDTIIRNKLFGHKSGIGNLIDSDTRGYRLIPSDIEEWLRTTQSVAATRALP